MDEQAQKVEQTIVDKVKAGTAPCDECHAGESEACSKYKLHLSCPYLKMWRKAALDLLLEVATPALSPECIQVIRMELSKRFF